jgi:alpha-beta hydrolase superfamily lysophospholipase
MQRLLVSVAAMLPILLVSLLSFGLWTASNQLLAPSWRGVERNLSICNPEAEQHWGEQCGNLRATDHFKFGEVRIPLKDGLALPGWLIQTQENNLGPGRGVIILVHAGGSDRREETRYLEFYLQQGLDVLTFDLECHGEAPCPTYGLSYGQRESRDVLAAYKYVSNTYTTIYAFGSSVGAASVLMALPEMPDVDGVIVENPYSSFRRLIKEAPEAEAMPSWFSDALINFSMWRGSFDADESPETAVRRTRTNVPIVFIHSKEDEVVSYQHTQHLADLYSGPKRVWLPAKGSHAAIWDSNRAEYEKFVGEFLNSVDVTLYRAQTPATVLKSDNKAATANAAW